MSYVRFIFSHSWWGACAFFRDGRLFVFPELRLVTSHPIAQMRRDRMGSHESQFGKNKKPPISEKSTGTPLRMRKNKTSLTHLFRIS